jgi:hypothetical protein
MTVTNKNYIRKEIKRRLNMRTLEKWEFMQNLQTTGPQIHALFIVLLNFR